MPRTLPWLAGSKTPAQSKPPARPSSPPSAEDNLDSDLNPVRPSTPIRNSAPQQPDGDKSPLTSPPPAPPSVKYMLPADEIWRMVEDEFLSTARLYTQHLHYAAYVQAKRRAAVRGRDTLEGLVRNGDGRTGRSSRTRLGIEARGKRKAAVEEVSEGEERMNPQLAGLMNSRLEAGLLMEGRERAKFGGLRRDAMAASGLWRSPVRVGKQRRVQRLREHRIGKTGSAVRMQTHAAVRDDSDDLDAIIARSPPAKKSAVTPPTFLPPSNPFSTKRPPADELPPKSSISNHYTESTATTSNTHNPSSRSTTKPAQRSSTATSNQPHKLSTAHNPSSSPIPIRSPPSFPLMSPQKRESVADFLAKRKAAKEKRALASSKLSTGISSRKLGGTGIGGQEEEEYDDVPTFMI